ADLLPPVFVFVEAWAATCPVHGSAASIPNTRAPPSSARQVSVAAFMVARHACSPQAAPSAGDWVGTAAASDAQSVPDVESVQRQDLLREKTSLPPGSDKSSRATKTFWANRRAPCAGRRVVLPMRQHVRLEMDELQCNRPAGHVAN